MVESIKGIVWRHGTRWACGTIDNEFVKITITGDCDSKSDCGKTIMVPKHKINEIKW